MTRSGYCRPTRLMNLSGAMKHRSWAGWSACCDHCESTLLQFVYRALAAGSSIGADGRFNDAAVTAALDPHDPVGLIHHGEGVHRLEPHPGSAGGAPQIDAQVSVVFAAAVQYRISVGG